MVVLDTSAVIALIRAEAGADVVALQIGQAAISAVNLQEILKVLASSGIPFDESVEAVDVLMLDIHPHGRASAIAAARLHDLTKQIGSGLGDRT